MMSMRRARSVVDAVAQRRRLLDGAGHVGERAVADVRGEGVEQQVDGDVRLDSAPPRRAARRRLDTGSTPSAARRWQPAAQLLAADPLDQVVGVGVLGDDGVGAVEQAAGRGGHAGVEDGVGGQPQPPDAVGGLGREPAGQLPRAGRRRRRAPLARSTAAAASRALATASSGPTAARARCHARAGESGGQRAGERPVGGPAIGARRVVVGGRAHQRVAERQPVAVEADDAVLLGGLQLGDAEPAVTERLERSARGRRRARRRRRAAPPRTSGSSRSSSRSTTRWPVRPIGSGSGSSARPARWSASSRLAASTSTSGMPPPAATSSRRTLRRC